MDGDLISRSALLKKAKHLVLFGDLYGAVVDAPSVDAVPMEDFKRLEKKAASLAKNNRTWRRKVQRIRSDRNLNHEFNVGGKCAAARLDAEGD